MLEKKNTNIVPSLEQPDLFKVEKQAEIDGVEMGVLENGIPFLTESGLARMCGIDRKGLNRMAADWSQERRKPRGQKIAELLKLSGYDEDSLFIRSQRNGILVNAYSEPVCIALLEYYAFIADEPRKQAVQAFRTLARTSFRLFIYEAVGYDPVQTVIDSWKHFHDRIDMTMGSVPDGYFSIFHEIASMIVPMIRAGIVISDKVVPDISVGIAWSNFWKEQNLRKYGKRIRYEHRYPLYYPQSRTNPQHAFAYPDAVLGTFRAWLRETYIAFKLPRYLSGQIRKGALPASTANQAIASLTQKKPPEALSANDRS